METHDFTYESIAALDNHREPGSHEFEVDDFHALQGWAVVTVTDRNGSDAGAFRIDIRETAITA
jgi:hypothetical protein